MVRLRRKTGMSHRLLITGLTQSFHGIFKHFHLSLYRLPGYCFPGLSRRLLDYSASASTPPNAFKEAVLPAIARLDMDGIRSWPGQPLLEHELHDESISKRQSFLQRRRHLYLFKCLPLCKAAYVNVNQARSVPAGPCPGRSRCPADRGSPGTGSDTPALPRSDPGAGGGGRSPRRPGPARSQP